MKIHPNVTIDRVMEACKDDLYVGFCISCGEQTDGIEPDARKYKCDCCGASAVYGAEELLIIIGGYYL